MSTSHLGRLCAILTMLLLQPGCSGSTDEKPQAKQEPTKATRATAGAADSPQLKRMKGKVIATKLSALQSVKQKAAYDFKVKYALKLYNAEKGRNPRNYKEFQQVIIEANQIVLPKIPDDARYEYRPKDGPYGHLWIVPKDGKSGGKSAGQY